MKQEDKQYEKWLAEVKSRQPILDNPEELTASILDRISGISPPKKQRKFLIGAWASGIAATLLLLLFINSIPLRANCEEMRLQEKNIYLSSQYTQHRKFRKAQILQVIKEKRLK